MSFICTMTCQRLLSYKYPAWSLNKSVQVWPRPFGLIIACTHHDCILQLSVCHSPATDRFQYTIILRLIDLLTFGIHIMFLLCKRNSFSSPLTTYSVSHFKLINELDVISTVIPKFIWVQLYKSSQNTSQVNLRCLLWHREENDCCSPRVFVFSRIIQ